MGKVLQFKPRQLGPSSIEDSGLELFVRQSNAIEGIYAEAGDPLYDDHLRAADLVSKAASISILDPEIIHRQLMKSQPEHTPGKPRLVWVGVGGRTCPDPMVVPRLLMQLKNHVSLLTEFYVQGNRPSEDVIWDLHHELEYIHPFTDGNGRTGRLWLNALRVYFGYDWEIVHERNRQEYYSRIVDYTVRRNLS